MVEIEIKLPDLDYQAKESFKLVRTNLQFCGEDKKVIVITSCIPNEGKSTISLNLSNSLAEMGKKVLLVDADLRKSVLVYKTRRKKDVAGLTHFLSGQVPLSEIICTTNIKNISIVFAGPTPPNPTELLGGELFKKMINSLQKVYDYILIDTPPLGSVVDCALVSKQCDGAIIVLESKAISRRLAKNVKEQLEKSKCPILGVILNKVEQSKSRYGKYYGKYEDMD